MLFKLFSKISLIITSIYAFIQFFNLATVAIAKYTEINIIFPWQSHFYFVFNSVTWIGFVIFLAIAFCVKLIFVFLHRKEENKKYIKAFLLQALFGCIALVELGVYLYLQVTGL